MLDLQTANQAIADKGNNHEVTPNCIRTLLGAVKGTTIASVTQVTDVKLAAAHKALKIQKVTIASVTLANNLKAWTDVYVNKVQRTSSNPGQEFVKSDNYFSHTDCYSLVKHKSQEKYYLFAMYNKSRSVYVFNGKLVSKDIVAAHMTPSAAKKLLEPQQAVTNVRNDIEHSAIVRTVGLASIVSISADKQTLTV